jgi:ABC-type lipoprotein release transport system permease subunit
MTLSALFPPVELFPLVDLTVLAVVLSVVTSAVLLVLLAQAVNQPVLLRMGWRNVQRRPSQTLLLLAGLSLSSFVITVSLGLWDSLNSRASVVVPKAFLASVAGPQFYWLLPLLSCLLVGAGMLLLGLLVTLLASSRRAELGMSRALGLQRSHLVQLLLFEGAGYGLLAVVVGVPLGFLLTALELGWLSHVPPFGIAGVGVVQTSLALQLGWQDLVIPGCLSLLVTLLTFWLTASWISRIPPVTAMRDLEGWGTGRSPLRPLLRTLWHPPFDRAGQPIPETHAGKRARKVRGALGLLWGFWMRGLFCLLAGGALLILATATGRHWLAQLAVAFLLAGLGLLVGWLVSLIPLPRMTKASAGQLGFSLIGVGWLVFGLQSGGTFLALFQSPLGYGLRVPSAMEVLLGLLLPVLGTVVLVLTTADLLGTLWSLLLRHLRRLAPLSRTSLAYPLTYRLRTGMTVTLLGLVLFLVLLLVTADLGALQEEQSATSNGGYQLVVNLRSRLPGRSMTPPAQMQAIQSHQLLGQDFSAVGLLRPLFYAPYSIANRLDLAGRPLFPGTPWVADDAFLSTTRLPTVARARGYTSDEQVWDAVRDHPGDAVLNNFPNIGLPTGNDFVPFTAEVPNRGTSVAHYHQVTIIGILPSGIAFRQLFISQRTAAQLVQPPFTGFNLYLFRLQPGVSLEQATQDLRRTLILTPGSVWDLHPETALIMSINQAVTVVLLFVLSGYLVLGLLFGVLAIGIIASRAVVERRQQIGMLRALGFSPTLVRRSFLLETSFVVTLSVLVGTPLALWQAYQVAFQVYRNAFPIPVWPVVFILLLSYLVVFVATLFPARQAARLHPAEALRYE